jgi:hypothetical protein
MDPSNDGDEDVDLLPSSHPARRGEFGGKNERKRNRGWGEAMELAHQQQHQTSSSSSAVAVDLNQFRNTEVGTGYQAKHVVRQKTASGPQMKTRTVNDRVIQGPAKTAESTAKPITLEELLKNDGLRAFRKEIESILSS